MGDFFRVEDLQVYQRLCELHVQVCKIAQQWPAHERFELGSQVRRASNGAAANLAEKHNDRHVKNKIEGVNRGRGEAFETVHHLYIAHLKGYLADDNYEVYRERYHECIRMLNGLERSYERQLPPADRKWPDRPTSA